MKLFIRNLCIFLMGMSCWACPEFTDFWQLLGYHDAITPEIQRAALAAEVFWPCEIYYHDARVVEQRVHGLLQHAFLVAQDHLRSGHFRAC